MGETWAKIITGIFILSILFLISTIVLVALTFALDFSGFNLEIIYPGCTGNNYLNGKLALLFMMLRVHTITAFIALGVSVLSSILIIKKYCHIREN